MDIINSFHFARPVLLWCWPIIGFLIWRYFRVRHIHNPWRQLMRADLQQQLLVSPQRQSRYWLWTGLALSLTIFAVAGPSWSQQSRPLFAAQDALVIVQDLSLSMLAADQQPNRITRSKQKISDLLQQRQEGLTALVVYAGDAHTVTPLTQDSATISSLLSALDPLMMPKLGSAAERGIQQALTLFRHAGLNKGRILLISDGVDEQALKAIPKLLNKAIELKILAVGSLEGAPIPLPNNSFAKDDSGNVIISKLDLNSLQQLAEATGSELQRLSLTDTDLDALLAHSIMGSELTEQEAKVPLWIEQGHWFLLPVLPLAALAFRRGWLLTVLLCSFLTLPFAYSPKVYAFWPFSTDPVTAQQQAGEAAFAEQRYQDAAKELQQPLWQGSAYYRLGDYEQAASAFAKAQSAEAHYNRGNALARAGQYQAALEAYQQALTQQPDLVDAQHNQNIVQQLLKEQQQEQQQPSKDQSRSEDQDSQDQQNQNDRNNTDPKNDSAQDSQASNDRGNPSPSQSPSQSQGETDSQDSASQAESQPSSQQQPPQDQQLKDQQPQDQTTQTESEASSNSTPPDEVASGTEETPANKSEAQRALEQWLRRVPDDPSDLLKRKFEYQSSLQNSPLSEGRSPW